MSCSSPRTPLQKETKRSKIRSHPEREVADPFFSIDDDGHEMMWDQRGSIEILSGDESKVRYISFLSQHLMRNAYSTQFAPPVMRKLDEFLICLLDNSLQKRRSVAFFFFLLAFLLVPFLRLSSNGCSLPNARVGEAG